MLRNSEHSVAKLLRRLYNNPWHPVIEMIGSLCLFVNRLYIMKMFGGLCVFINPKNTYTDTLLFCFRLLGRLNTWLYITAPPISYYLLPVPWFLVPVLVVATFASRYLLHSLARDQLIFIVSDSDKILHNANYSAGWTYTFYKSAVPGKYLYVIHNGNPLCVLLLTEERYQIIRDRIMKQLA